MIPGTLFSRNSFGDPTGLPPAEDGVFLIVSGMVQSALPGRLDLVTPVELVRDSEGKVLGCRSLGLQAGAEISTPAYKVLEDDQNRPMITGISFAEEAAAKAEFAAIIAAKYPQKWEIGVSLVEYDETPVIWEEQIFPIVPTRDSSGVCTIMAGADINLLEDGYNEYPYTQTVEIAMAKAIAIHGNRINVSDQTVILRRKTGGNPVDGTGRIWIFKINNPEVKDFEWENGIIV